MAIFGIAVRQKRVSLAAESRGACLDAGTNHTLLQDFAHHRRSRGMDEKQLAKLVKKTVAKASKPKVPQRRTYDATLDVTRRPATEQDAEALELFEQMKKREF